MTAPEHQEPEPQPQVDGQGQSDQDLNFQRLRERAEIAEARASAAEQVLEAAGIEVSEDGSFDPDQLRTRFADSEAVHRAAVVEAGFDPNSGKGKSLARDLEAGMVETTPDEDLAEAVRAHAQTDYGWGPEKLSYSPKEIQTMVDSRRLGEIQSAGMSQAGGEPMTEIEAKIADARAEGDFALASRLQSEWDRKQEARRR